MKSLFKTCMMSFALLGSLLLPAMQSHAGVLAVFGDVNSMNDNTAGRNKLLSNLLGSGTRVLESKQNTDFPSAAPFSSYYNTVASVKATASSADITTALLNNYDLLFLNIGCCGGGAWSNPYSTTEIQAMAGFLQNGGTIGILEEPCCTDTAAVNGMNTMLASLGSTMRYTNWVGNYGIATMLPSQLSTGVTGYAPNTFGVITGGVAVAQVAGYTAVAYEVIGGAKAVPEPASLALLGLGLAGLGIVRRKKRG